MALQSNVAPIDSREAAERAAKLLGAKGAHEYGGGWLPCESQEALQVLLKDGLEAYEALQYRSEKRAGKAHRVITREDLAEEQKARPKKRRKRYTRWENIRERSPSVVSGPPGLTSGKGENPHKDTGILAALLPSEETATPYLQKEGLPLEELHLTLGFFGGIELEGSLNSLQLKESLVKWAWTQSATCAPISALVNGVAKVGDSEPQAVVLLVEHLKLLKMRESLDQGVRQMALNRKHPGFLPHVTLGYGIDMDIKPGEPILFDHIAIWWGEERIKLPLIGSPA